MKNNSSIQLHYLLATQSLRLNPHALAAPADLSKTAPSSAQLLEKLRARIDGFANFKPTKITSTPLHESDGRLYEYLEGTLLRGVGDQEALPFELAVYDMKKAAEKLEAETMTFETGGETAPTSDEAESPSSSGRAGISGDGHEGEEGPSTEGPSDASADSWPEVEIVYMDELEMTEDEDGNWTEDDSDDMGDAMMEDDTSSDESSIDVPTGAGAGVFVSQGELEDDETEAEESNADDTRRDPAADPDIRRSKRFPFQIAEMATDPGQDLLVLVEVR